MLPTEELESEDLVAEDDFVLLWVELRLELDLFLMALILL